jgi:dihydropyrimidine dehydrogenase (NAD+) subunit PreT
VTIRHWAAPQAVLTEGGRLTGMRFADTTMKERKLVLAGSGFTLPADMVLRAIGQTFVAEGAPGVALEQGRIGVDSERRTSVPGVWAGGDCCAGGRDLTVEAVEDGKVAARSIHAALLK